MTSQTPDLTQRPPRSPRVRLGGYVILTRVLDKGRATLADQHGEYKFNCPLDQRLFAFAGIDAEALKQQLVAGSGDGEILAWITAHSTTRPSSSEIAAWSLYQEQRGPGDPESREYFNGIQMKVAPKREDIVTWFDLLDVDDYVSFGGKA